ncbi:hypothetical protein LTR62_000981 [Meristemomyces frigidus]|uniref:HTH APSES-type domain-containing protein n=1 Tax=Meristemomyces frigidus TaxID=1508187 RepID=A0AAN7T9K2_9PEZI|nr:hypothetical protein LTR62_000981 [Meristemomyces frigidus]
MAERILPAKTNPMLSEEHTPQYGILVERRCLGQTELKVKPGQVGTSNATDPKNLGTLEYAHLRVPLPRDLTGTGIFTKNASRKWPEAYFLMRRSSDGFISATGMFKAAYPFAQVAEEQAEKDYIKSMEGTSSEEVAGNVWIHPDEAVELAEEYGIKVWIQALLDPEPITHGTSPGKAILSPPAYKNFGSLSNGSMRSPEKKNTEGRSSTRGRRSASVLSADPDAAAKTPSRVKATPRKPRKGRGALSKVDEDQDGPGTDVVNGGAPPVEFGGRNTVKVEVETTTRPSSAGGEELEETRVNIEMPADHPDLPLPENAEAMLEKARQMVAEAQKVGGPSRSGKGKRKAEMLEDDDEGDASSAPLPAKRARKIEVELRKERVLRRSYVALAATLGFGALIPTIMAALGS